jgi:hypothetical protein
MKILYKGTVAYGEEGAFLAVTDKGIITFGPGGPVDEWVLQALANQWCTLTDEEFLHCYYGLKVRPEWTN